MSQVFDFKKGDVIEYADEQFVVISNRGKTGRVHCLHDPQDVIDPFYWTAYGESSKLIRRAAAV